MAKMMKETMRSRILLTAANKRPSSRHPSYLHFLGFNNNKRGTAGIDEEIKITNKRKKHRPAVIDDSLSCGEPTMLKRNKFAFHKILL